MKMGNIRVGLRWGIIAFGAAGVREPPTRGRRCKVGGKAGYGVGDLTDHM